MRPPKRTAAVITSAVLVLGVGTGIAQAQKGGAKTTGAATMRGGPGPGPGAQAIAQYLGLTAAELRTQLEAGKTLADVAKAQGKTVSGLEDAIVADAKTHLDAAVADGQLTAAQAATMLTDLKSHVDDMVNNAGPGGPRHGGPGHGLFDASAVTDYLGLTAAELRTQIESGKSLADVAKANGKTVSGLEDAIVAATTKKLDAAVAAGKLTAAQEATMLTELKSHVDDMVNRTGPPPRLHGADPGGAGLGLGAGASFRPISR